ncbi:MAG: c-type cytochrome [Gemmatimonadetes bacterium]|nr:c-type cytochrome [Gemmatimonadota bacterium]
MRAVIPVLVSLAWLGACGGSSHGQPEQANRDSIQADSAALASKAFDSTVFDTITWKKEGADTARGSVVYRVSCVRCHGEDGAGVKNAVFRGDTLNVPSFLGPDWALADSPMVLRKLIFVGDSTGMPHFGIIGLHYRDVDAVARYIMKDLRAGDTKKK